MSILTFHTNSGSVKTSMGSGILPVAKYQNKVYFLFGEECYLALDGGWSDFGGAVEDNESIFDGAIREGYEETLGFFGNQSELKDLINNNLISCIESDNYKSYMFQIDYCNKLPFYYNRNFNYVSKNIKNIIGQNGYYEKKKIKWIDFYELEESINLFRNFYKPFIKTIINNFSVINEKLK